MPFSTRAPAILLAGYSLVISAAEPGAYVDTIETSVGEISYFQLTSSLPTGKPTPAVRVQDTNRDYSVVKVTFEAGEAGAKNRLKIRNGYDIAIYFAMNEGCVNLIDPASGQPDKRDHLLLGVPPGVEVTMEIPVSKSRILMCEFTVPFPADAPKILETLQRPAPSQ